MGGWGRGAEVGGGGGMGGLGEGSSSWSNGVS